MSTKTDTVMVATARSVYVVMTDRAAFDRIGLPLLASEKVLVKSMDNGDGVTVHFQLWLQ